MPIIEDYDAIAKRLHDIRTASPKSLDHITDLERWHDLAQETAHEYLESRRRGTVMGTSVRPRCP